MRHRFLFFVMLAAFLVALPFVAKADSFDTLSGWSVNRFPPAVFAIDSTTFAPENVLQLGIRGPAQTDDFYNYQGYGHDFALSGIEQSVSIDMFVDDAGWAGMDVDAQFWVRGNDGHGNTSANAIIEYRQSSTNAFDAGFYSFDYENTGDRRLLTSGISGWNTLTITLDVGAGMQYSIDGVNFSSTTDPLTVNIDRVIVSAFNSGQDYDVFYDNLTTVGAVPTPSAVSGIGLLAAVVGVRVYRRRRSR